MHVKTTEQAFRLIAGHLNLSEIELTMYLDNPVVHHETFALVMSIRRNKLIIMET